MKPSPCRSCPRHLRWEGAMLASSRRWVNRIEVYWQPLSLLSRILIWGNDLEFVCLRR